MGFKEFDEIMEKEGDKIPFKKFTHEGDIILLVTEQIMLWGFVKNIGEVNAEGLRNVKLKLLALPPIDLDLNINDNQLDGCEHFLVYKMDAFIKPIDFHIDDDSIIDKMNERIEQSLIKPILVEGNKLIN